MNKSLLHSFVGSLTCAALFCTGLLPLSAVRAEEDSAPFDPSAVLRSPAPELGEALALDMSRIIGTQTQLIRYEATAYQRQVAEARARAFMAAHRRQIATAKEPRVAKESHGPKSAPKSQPEEPAKTVSKGKKESKVAKGSSTTKEPKVAAKSAPAPTAKPGKATSLPDAAKELPRYIAVDTVKDERASPKAKKVVMIFDTHAEKLVGNNIYDVERPPQVGDTKVFQTYSAQYIGAGL